MKHIEEGDKKQVNEVQGNEGDYEHEFHKEDDERVGVYDNFFNEDYVDLVSDSEFDRYERSYSPTNPSSHIDPPTYIVSH